MVRCHGGGAVGTGENAFEVAKILTLQDFVKYFTNRSCSMNAVGLLGMPVISVRLTTPSVGLEHECKA
jgi:hypothetical protein